MKYKRMPIEAESPEELGYGTIACNLAESSVADTNFKDLKFNFYPHYSFLIQSNFLITHFYWISILKNVSLS